MPELAKISPSLQCECRNVETDYMPPRQFSPCGIGKVCFGSSFFLQSGIHLDWLGALH